MPSMVQTSQWSKVHTNFVTLHLLSEHNFTVGVAKTYSYQGLSHSMNGAVVSSIDPFYENLPADGTQMNDIHMTRRELY